MKRLAACALALCVALPLAAQTLPERIAEVQATYDTSAAALPSHVVSAIIAAEDWAFEDRPAIRSTLTAYAARLLLDRMNLSIREPDVGSASPAIGINLVRRGGHDAVLDAVVNLAFFGRDAFGVTAAGREWFGKAAADLTIGEAAYLAGLIRAPSAFAADRERARARRDFVLSQMVVMGAITSGEAEVARLEDVP